MKNINKNAVQALWVDGKAFLTHKAIDSFTMGQGDFTIEVSFICNEVRDCLFYAQEQGFAFGIRNGLLYFELDGMGSITQKEGVDIVTDVLLSAAVSCREGKLSLYFEGLPIADQVEVTSAPAENSGTYEIGKGLKGYIVELRLRSCGMTDQDILSDNGMGLTDCESIEFWTDFTSVQYRDKSPNALGLSTMQGSVKCVNVTSCTSLELHGGYVTMAKKSYGEAYTLLFKIYPQLESFTKMYVYSAVGADGTIFSIGVESDSEGDKQIFVENGGVVYQGNSALPLMSWIDIGLRVENGNAQLYIDGVLQLEFAFTGKLDNISSIIGIKPFEKKIVCKDGFWGYLDYFAEFDCALSEEMIAYYAEEQPYIFDESINSLYAFYCGDPIDLLTGNMLLSIGSGKAVFEKELNNLSTPIGMDLRVPQEVCAEWKELDEYEQWATTAAMDMVREVYSQSMGYTIPEGIVPIEQAATKTVMKLFEEEIYLSKIVWPPEEEEVIIKDFIEEATMKGVGGRGMAVACLRTIAVVGTAGAVAAGAVMGGKVAITTISVVIVGGACVTLVRRIVETENNSKRKKPKDKNGRVDLISVCCNHNGNPQEGSIHFHSDASLISPEGMVYVNKNNFSIDMLLVTNAIENLCVNCILTNTTNKSVTGVFGLKGQLSEVFVEKEITIPAYGSIEIPLYILFVNKEFDDLIMYFQEGWEFFFDGQVICYCTANVYLQKDLPIEPWNAHIGEAYYPEIKDYPSLYFIRKMILEPQNFQEIDNNKIGVSLNGEVQDYFYNILNRLYRCNTLRYDYETMYTLGINFFRLSDFLNAIRTMNCVKVNCTDCANIVSLIAAEFGIEMGMNLILGLRGFICNQITSMPSDDWHDEEFNYHQVAFYSENGQFSNKTEIYDLSLKIDVGYFPNLKEIEDENFQKQAALSSGYWAYETVGYLIDIEEPYDKTYYLERLVKKGELASFQDNVVYTVILDNEVLQVRNELYMQLIQHYTHSYELIDGKYADEIPQLTVQPLFFQKAGLEIKRENQYECDWAAPDGMRVTWFRNAEHLPAGEYLASVLMRFSCRLTEKEAPELGERVFYGPDLLITYFEGSAYLIECKEMEKAEEMIHNLKGSMI